MCGGGIVVAPATSFVPQAPQKLAETGTSAWHPGQMLRSLAKPAPMVQSYSHCAPPSPL